MMNSFNLTLCGKHFICPSILNDSFAGYSNLGCRSLHLILGNVIMMCLGVFLLGSSSFGTLWASWTSRKSISFARLGKVSFIMFSNKFSISCSSSSPSGTLRIQMLEHLKLSWRFLSLSSFFGILVSSFFSGSVSYTHLTLPTRRDSCRSRWSPYH